jgi:hypothetical protein
MLSEKWKGQIEVAELIESPAKAYERKGYESREANPLKSSMTKRILDRANQGTSQFPFCWLGPAIFARV